MLIQWYLEDLFSKQLLIGQINTAMRWWVTTVIYDTVWMVPASAARYQMVQLSVEWWSEMDDQATPDFQP